MKQLPLSIQVRCQACLKLYIYPKFGIKIVATANCKYTDMAIQANNDVSIGIERLD